MTRPDDRSVGARESAPPGTPAIARPARCSAPYRDHARLTRLWADGTHLHLVGPGLQERRRLGGDGLTEVVHIDTAAYDLDHGADPLHLTPGGWIELPAQDGAPPRRLAVYDWLSDRDRVNALEVADPLAASSLGPVLDSAGISVAIPGTDRLLLLTFSTPLPVPPLVDALVDLFDAIAEGARWVQ